MVQSTVYSVDYPFYAWFFFYKIENLSDKLKYSLKLLYNFMYRPNGVFGSSEYSVIK